MHWKRVLSWSTTYLLIHTHVINRHIYKHTYTPQYTASEENQIVNVDPGNCCQFM